MLPEHQELDLSPASAHGARRAAHVPDAEHSRAPCEEPPPGTFPPVAGPVRTFCDREGIHWRVYAMPVGGEAAPSLVFESVEGVRRIKRYPAGWQALTERDLECLSWAD